MTLDIREGADMISNRSLFLDFPRKRHDFITNNAKSMSLTVLAIR